MQIETRNRFRSLRSKPIDIEEKKVEIKINEQILISDNKESTPKTLSFKEREIFHDTFSFLIKLVNNYFVTNNLIFNLLIFILKIFKHFFLHFIGKYRTKLFSSN